MSSESIFNKLREDGILQKDEKLDRIRSDLHYTKLWADAFWRRKKQHSRRVDPEIAILDKLDFSSILEIGVAYGRVAYKIIEKFPSISYTGIEVCSHSADYHKQYSKNKNQKMNLITDNFFETDQIKQKFDIIILPMNTLPSFSYKGLPNLFESVKRYLAPEGKFIFSNYKLPEIINEKNIDEFRSNRNGEILFDKNTSDRLAVENYQVEYYTTDYGARSTNIQLYHRLNNEYRVIERELFWTQLEYITKDNLLRILEQNGFLVECDNSSHSTVYIVSKE